MPQPDDARTHELFARAYWEQAPHSFAHITRAQATFTSTWRKQWLDPLLHLMGGSQALRHTCVVDVGIGGAALGVLLLKEYGVLQYIGIDIAHRQLSVARAKLLEHGFPEYTDSTNSNTMSTPGFSLYLAPINFSRFGHCSLLVCLAAMQHFPSQKYTEAWLRNADTSDVRWLMLQPRWSATPIFSNWGAPGSHESRSVANGSRFDASWMLGSLEHYELRWTSPLYNSYVFYAFERTAQGDVKGHSRVLAAPVATVPVATGDGAP